VNKADGTVAATIQVKVNNQKPVRSEKVLTELITMTEYGASSNPDVPAKVQPFAYPIDEPDKRAFLITVPGGLASYFKDDDGATDLEPTKFKVMPKDTTSVIVREVQNDGVIVDVIYKDGDSFDLEVIAVDSEKDESPDSLIVSVHAEYPRAHDYDIEQFDETGNFRHGTIGLRWGTAHVLNIRNIEWPTTADSDVALEFIEDWTEPDWVTSLNPPTDADVNTSLPDGVTIGSPVVDDDSGKRYIKISVTGPVNPGTYRPAGTNTADGESGDNYPDLAFTLRGAGSQLPQTGEATITIEYYVAYDKDDAAGLDHSPAVHMVEKRDITLTIERVT
jgi:hypothetical protein